MKSKQVIISQDLFMSLCRYHLTETASQSDDMLIKSELESKLRRLAAHDDYTKKILEREQK